MPTIGLLACLLVVVLPVAAGAQGAADQPVDQCPTLPGNQTWEQDCPEAGGTPGDDGGGTTPIDYEDMGPVWDIGLTVVDGEQCWMIQQVEDGMTWSEAVALLDAWDGNDVALQACDFGDGGPPTVYTRWIRNRCPPPPPTPVTLDPDNRAITGKAGYLAIGGEQSTTVPCGAALIEATARYVVDWGDGTTTETTSRGGEWPDGDLTHVYEDKGDYTLTVEAYWTGTVGGITLPELPVPTTASIDVPVTEVQAVVTEQH